MSIKITDEEMVAMAREAGLGEHTNYEYEQIWELKDTEAHKRFAALVIAAERERCALVCEEFYSVENIAQEPVAWMSDCDVGFIKSEFGKYPCVPLYTAPPRREWVGLTGDEIEDLPKDQTWWQIIRAVEAKLREKNT